MSISILKSDIKVT